jgi:RimJ/RimL family protein N-acetyltransferase
VADGDGLENHCGGNVTVGSNPTPSAPPLRTPPGLVWTERLVLRHWEEQDLEAFFDLYSREDVVRWLGAHPRRPLATMQEARERLGRWRAHERGLASPLGLWAMVPCAAGEEPVGTLLLLPLSDDGGPTGLVEVGLHLHPRHQGQGLATEAARAVLDLAGQTGLDQVLALTDLDNIASQRVATRLGMQDEGVTGRWFGLTMRQYRKVIVNNI